MGKKLADFKFMTFITCFFMTCNCSSSVGFSVPLNVKKFVSPSLSFYVLFKNQLMALLVRSPSALSELCFH